MIAISIIAANTSMIECCFKNTVEMQINNPQTAAIVQTRFLCLPKVFDSNTAHSITSVL